MLQKATTESTHTSHSLVFLMNLKPYALEIIRAVNSGKVQNKRELNNLKIALCKQFSIPQMPTDPDILAFAEPRTKRLTALLGVKPVRSLSGIAVCAVMAKPHPCPGECTYCPGGLDGAETPKSYTGKEPATMRGLMFNFDPYKQVRNRIEQLQAAGHQTEKLELIVMGGTFPSTAPQYQTWFVKRCLDACSGQGSANFARAKTNAETAPNRVIGTTFETRPDFCTERHISHMLRLGGTRVELGVQTLHDKIYGKINRGHTVKDVADATSRLKDSAFKACYHMMPGLPGSNAEQDLQNFRMAFDDARFKPDMLKIYPCSVIEGTPLYKEWKKGGYRPLTTEQAAELIAKIKPLVPKWVRIMRVQRDTPTTVISAGIDKSNLRQVAQQKMHAKGKRCSCIRCREAGLRKYKEGLQIDPGKIKINEISYAASNGTEVFISADGHRHDSLLGFCRLRIPTAPFRRELGRQTALIRELRVFGTALPLGKRPKGELQHHALGKRLLQRAEETARGKFGVKKAAVICGFGVREYYRSLGYANDGDYVSKQL